MQYITDSNDLQPTRFYWVRTLPDVRHHLSHLRQPTLMVVGATNGESFFRIVSHHGATGDRFWLNPSNNYFDGKLTAVGPVCTMDVSEWDLYTDHTPGQREILTRGPVVTPEMDAIQPHIVCAATRSGIWVIPSPRHYDYTYHMLFNAMEYEARLEWLTGKIEQGFIDQFGRFYTRSEALVVARANGQYRPRDTRSSDQLYSEDLY